MVANINIDVYMLWPLRKTLQEKLDGFNLDQEKNVNKVNSKTNKKKRAEVKEALNNTIRMMINSSLNFFLKMPLVFL